MPNDLTAWRRRLDPLLDPVLALAVGALSLLPLLRDLDCGCAPHAWWAYLLVVAQCAPLGVRRRFPVAVPLLVGLLAMAYGVSDLPDPAVPFAALVALYTVAAYVERHLANAAAVFAVIGTVAVYALDWPNWDAEDLSSTVLLFTTAWLLGEITRSRHDRAVHAEARAEQLERTRAAESAAAVSAERNRIARDLHDVVAHHVSMMVVQAEAGPVVVHGDPDRAAAAFDTISEAGKQALADMRGLLGVLREDDAVPLGPQPGVETVPDLVAGVRSAGLEVDLTIDVADPLPASVDLTAYRLVQEALTNSIRHARAMHVRVHLEVQANELVVEVVDDGIGGTLKPGEGGHGLVAMRERVQLVGGRLEVGPRPDGGWSVRARLPLDRPAP